MRAKSLNSPAAGRHRCLVPANGFYEWATVASKKQPHYIHPADLEGFFALAGLLAAWKSPTSEMIVSTCIITTGHYAHGSIPRTTIHGRWAVQPGDHGCLSGQPSAQQRQG